jgi:hypothetical protein
MGKHGARCMKKKDRTGAMGKRTKECDPEREVMSHWCWYRCWQQSIAKVPPKHQ